MLGSDSRQSRQPSRINSAPPDEGEPGLKDSPEKKSQFNTSASEFIPSFPIPKPDTSLDPAANEFKPSIKIFESISPEIQAFIQKDMVTSNTLKATAKEFSFNPSAFEFVSTVNINKFETSSRPTTDPVIVEMISKPETIEEGEEESDDDYNSSSEEEKLEYLQIEKVNGKHVYTLENIEKIRLIFEHVPQFSQLDEFLLKTSQRTLLARKKENRSHNKKISAKDKEWRDKERNAPPQVVNWRREKSSEEEKIISKAREHTAKLKSNVEDEEKVKRQIRVTLNKLSPNNVEKLQNQLLITAKESYEKLGLLVKGIFDKAWSEPKYTQMYAKLCGLFKEEFETFKYSEEEGKQRNHFRHKLLHICEEAFTYNPLEDIVEGLDEEQKENKRVMLRKKTLGNVRFIGELFNVKLITAKVVLLCVHDLVGLPNKDEAINVINHMDEDKLEGACILLSTGGNSFERSKLKPDTDRIYGYLEDLVKQKTDQLSNKIRFLIMNLIDGRANGWNKSKKEEVKKIEDIHAEFRKEQNEIIKRHERRA